MVEVTGTFLRRPLGRPRKYSARGLAVSTGRNGACRPAAARPRAPRAAGRARPTGSPFSFTPPCAIRRRASRGRPDAEARRRAAPAGAPDRRPASATSGTSSGRLAAPDDAGEVLLGRRARPPRPCERATMNRASASFASSGSPSGAGRSAISSYHSASWSSEIRIVRPNISSGAAVSGMLLPTDELIFAPSQREQERRRQHDLRLEAVVRHHLAAGEQVVELVGAAELDVGLDRDRVVGLHQRVEELGDRDRLLRLHPLLEVVALEDPRDGDRPREPDDVGVGQLREPLAVVPHLGALGVEDRPSPARGTSSRSRRSPRRSGSAAPPSGPTGRRSGSCSRRRSGRRCGPRPGTRASAAAGSRGRRGCRAR